MARGFQRQVLRQLSQHGITYRKAEPAYRALFRIIAMALARGERVETPLGTFETVSAPRSRIHFRLGTAVRQYRGVTKRVRFRRKKTWP